MINCQRVPGFESPYNLRRAPARAADTSACGAELAARWESKGIVVGDQVPNLPEAFVVDVFLHIPSYSYIPRLRPSKYPLKFKRY